MEAFIWRQHLIVALIVGKAPPGGGLSFRLGCGGVNINSAQRSHEEIRQVQFGFLFFKNMPWQKCLVQIATKNMEINMPWKKRKQSGTKKFFISSLAEFMLPPPHPSLKERPPQEGLSCDQLGVVLHM
jgi:hypothetical protein